MRRAQLSNRNGWMVDAHTKGEYKKMKLYLTRDGNAGVAIKRNGDVVSLFAKGGANNMGKLIPFAVAHGGRKLDCFVVRGEKNLANMYSRFGARATGKTAFDPEYAPNLWKMKSAEWKADPQNRPMVMAMILPDSLNKVVRRYDADRKIDPAKVRTFADYMDMIDARDAQMAREMNAAKLRTAFGSGR